MDEFEAAGYREPNTEAVCESLRLRCHFSLLTYLLQEQIELIYKLLS